VKYSSTPHLNPLFLPPLPLYREGLGPLICSLSELIDFQMISLMGSRQDSLGAWSTVAKGATPYLLYDKFAAEYSTFVYHLPGRF
jgi:hypothetical protein